jgi:hypothetical protein
MINSVRNTVLSVLNKNNYGYISPSDFNQYALQAQMEFFDEYFSSYNKIINAENARMSGTDFAHVSKTIAEVLDTFLTTNFLVPEQNGYSPFDNVYSIPSLTTTGDEAYMINAILCYTNLRASAVNTSADGNKLVDSGASFLSSGIVPGDIVINVDSKLSTTVVSVLSNTELSLNADIFGEAGVLYRVYAYNQNRQAEKVSNAKISILTSSLLTTPNRLFPAYTENSGKLVVYPNTFGGYGAIQATYFRYPKVPKWTYITLAGGEPVFDQTQSDYQDFELPQEDEYKLIQKILQYCGMSIRESQVVQFGMAQEQHEQPSFSQKQ